MSARFHVLVACLCLAALPAGTSAATKLDQVVYLRVGGGVALWDLADFEAALERDQAFHEAGGLVAEYASIEAANAIALEAGARVSSNWSVGLAYSYERKKFENSASGRTLLDVGAGADVDATATISDDFTLVVWEMSANLSFWFPYVRGFYVGISGGLAGGKVEENITIDAESAGESYTGSALGEYDNTDPIAGVFAGFQYEFRSAPLIYVEMGYRQRNLGPFEGSASGSGDIDVVKPADELTDYRGKLVGVMDFSGYYARAGIGFAFD